MAKGNGEAAVEKVKSAHITGCCGHSISTDGTTAMLLLEVGEGEQFALTLPTLQLKWLRSILTDMIAAVEKAGQPPGNVILRKPGKFSIGSSNELRGQVIISFDPDTPDEAIYVFDNQDGLKIAEGIKRDIMPRLTMEERRAAQTIPSLMTPPKGIIQP